VASVHFVLDMTQFFQAGELWGDSLLVVEENPSLKGCMLASPRSGLFEIALVLLRFDHVARFVVNADHGMM
jgi:hypothetical protein